MTRATLKVLMRSWLDDVQGAYFDDTQCNLWLNLAAKEVQKLLMQAGQNFYVKPVETTTVINQADYVLPSDFLVENSLEIIIAGYGTTSEQTQSLKEVTLNQRKMIPVQSGTPFSYFIKKDRITLAPIPSQAFVMRLFYSPVTLDMQSDSDSPDVPQEYHEFVAILATYDGFIKDDRAPSNLELKRATYEKRLEQMANNRTQDAPRMVVMTNDDGDFGSAW